MQANSLRCGMGIVRQNQVYLVVDFAHRTPGNKRAFVQVSLKNLSTGQVIQEKYSAAEAVAVAHLEPKKCQYLYHDREGFHFMDLEDYHTFSMCAELIEDLKYYLKENMDVEMMFYEEKPIQLNLPRHVILKVVDSPPGIRGDSVSSNNKPATLETGLKISVPLFIKEGTNVKIDTKTGNYLGRE